MRSVWYVVTVPLVAYALGQLEHAKGYSPVEGEAFMMVPPALPPDPDPLPLVEISAGPKPSALTREARRAVITWAELEVPDAPAA